MTLFRHSLHHLRWFSSVWQQLVRHTPFAAPATALMLLISQLAQVVAFLLPLKVILLLGGSGIPRYFRGFVSLETKGLWIVLLCVGAVLLYVLSQVMDWLADRQSRKGAFVVLDNARKITMFNDQGEGVREHYRRVCEVMADGASVVVGMAVGLFIFPSLFGFLLLMMIVMVGLPLLVVDVGRSHFRARAERWLALNSRGLFRVLGALGFLTGFLFLVAEFYRVDELNLLIAIISLILSRRIFQALVNFANGQVRLAEQHERVDALFFHEKQLQSGAVRHGQRFWQMYAREARLTRSQEACEKIHGLKSPTRSIWVDSGQGNVPWFELDVGPAVSRCVLEKVYFPKQHSQAKQEVYLLKRVDWQAIHAPRLLHWGELEDFHWLQLDCPVGDSVEREAWGEVQRQLTQALWCYTPPEEVVDSFLRSQPPLWSRVDSALIERVALAAESDVERDRLAVFQGRLPDMQARLKRMPLCIHNPEMNDRNVRIDVQGEPCLLSWGRWSLEPVGVGATPKHQRKAREGELLESLRARRRMPAKMTNGDLLLAHALYELERFILRQQYRRALDAMAQVLEEQTADDVND